MEQKIDMHNFSKKTYASIGIIVVLAAIIVIGHFVSAASISIAPPSSPATPPSFLNISSTAQGKSGWLGIGMPDPMMMPSTVTDVRGTFITDVLGILGTSWISEKLHIGGTVPTVGAGDPAVLVEGSRIKSLVLAGSGERGVCSDSNGRLIICGSVTPATATCGYAAAYAQGGSGTITFDNFDWGRTANPYLCNTGVPVLPVYTTGGVETTPGHWSRIYNRWSCAGTDGGSDVACWTEGICPSGAGCFLPGTMITLADGSKKTIETVQVTDHLLAGNEKINDVKSTVSHRYVGWVYGINGSKPFVTANHPMMTPAGWKSFDPELTRKTEPDVTIVGKLSVGDLLIKEGGTQEKITSLNREWMDTTVYNFVVSGDHTYYADTYQVHNTAGSVSSFCSSDPSAPTPAPVEPASPASICTGTLFSSPGCNISGVPGAVSATMYTYPTASGTFVIPYNASVSGYGCFVTYSATDSSGAPLTQSIDCMDIYRVE